MSARISLPALILAALAFAGCAAAVKADSADGAKEAHTLTIRDSNGVKLISQSDIQGYDFKKHIVTLTKGLRRRLHDRLVGQLVGGSPFEVHVGGRLCYKGNFTSSLSSRSLDTVVTVLSGSSELDDDQIQITLGYPSPGWYVGDGDLRNHQDVMTALEPFRRRNQDGGSLGTTLVE